MRRPAFLMIALLPVALLAACAEMRQPPEFARIPPGLGVASADPVPAMIAEAAAAFSDGGASLNGRPAEAARAIGQMELVAEAFRRNPRWAPVSAATVTELRTARTEWRQAIGIPETAAPETVAVALGQASLALRENDTQRAAAALAPAAFMPGGAPAIARLAAPGPLPQARIASALARDEVARMARMQLGGVTGALDPDAPFLNSLTGAQIPGTMR
ncbi:hypothetical protein DFH01_26400 [Falsiroseomonas bella]|uniref:Uncharacterized protein n=1 Tax=Falsiroseomonas bella TaxID=2184016 RepID=A0A317F6J4_9PROT|nr:hypothetical protein [Falsiroseomonas bella]PWS34162.1 hypothetical protein DFH01_26400 [Falsiroseomonas bella]